MTHIAGYRRPYPGTQPNHLHPPYVSSIKRAPLRPLVRIPHTLTEITGPQFGSESVDPKDCDLTRQHAGEPLGERIVVSGRVLDENARPVPQTLIEIWQANAAGRYLHKVDQHDAPLDPNFTGCGHVLTDSEGRYRFVTIRPGEYPGAITTTLGDPRTFTFLSSGRLSPRAWSHKCFSPAIPCFRTIPFSTAQRTRKPATG